MSLTETGTVTKLVNRASIDTYETIAAKTQEVRAIFHSRSIVIRSGSALDQLLKQADKLSKAWIEQKSPTPQVIFETAHVYRLADAITRNAEDPGVQQIFMRMARSVMQPYDRTASQGKDALWEVALLSDLKSNGLSAKAAEPDILVDVCGHQYPIACKKIWSESNVENQIRKASKQLAPFTNGGVIALNLDDLTPTGKYLRQSNKNGALATLSQFNIDFINRHEKIIKNSVSSGKCDGFYISTSCVVVLDGAEEPPYIATQSNLWNTIQCEAVAYERFISFAHAQTVMKP